MMGVTRRFILGFSIEVKSEGEDLCGVQGTASWGIMGASLFCGFQGQRHGLGVRGPPKKIGTRKNW